MSPGLLWFGLRLGLHVERTRAVFGKCLEQRIESDFESYVPLELRKVRVLREKLIERLEEKGEKIRPMFRRKLDEAISEIDQEFTEVSKRTKNDVLASRNDLWQDLVNEEALVKSVWASERSAYGAVYYAYECFLHDSVRIARGSAEYHIQNAKTFKKHFADLFGEELTHACCSDEQINTARFARNALVHNGGRMTDELQKQSHNFRVDGDLIQIGASDTTQLYNLLSQRVQQFARHATTLVQFVRDKD